MINEKLMLTDLIAPEYLQNLQDSISDAADVSTIMLDSSDTPITKRTNARGICKLMEDSDWESGVCAKARKELCNEARKTNKPVIITCPISGTTSAAVPFFLNEIFLGTLIIGQVLLEDDAMESVTNAMGESGIYADRQELLGDIPVLERSEFETIVDFMSIITEEIVKLTSSSMEIIEKNIQLTELAGSLKRSKEAMSSMADTPDICIYITDLYTGEVLMCNTGYASCFGKSYEELIGTYCFENLGLTSRCHFCPFDKLIDESDNPLPHYAWEHYFEQLGLHLQITNRAVRWIDGRLVNVSTSLDISKRKEMEEELQEMAFFDRSLRIPNFERMEQDIREGGRQDCLVAVTFSDLGKINNIFGRACGDALLSAVRDYIHKISIQDSILYRGKLNDFFILFKNTEENKDIPVGIAKKIHERCKKVWLIPVDEQWHNIFTSVDVCVIPLDSYHKDLFGYINSTLEHSLEIARKTGGVVIYDGATRERFQLNLRLEHCLKNAVREGMREFHLVFQPIIDMRRAMWTGVEVLCRWESLIFGSVPPGVFIPMAESAGLIGSIGLWVLEQSIIQVKALGLDRIKGFVLEVNLSPIQLNNPQLDKIIVELLNKHDYPPEKLGLEVTESNELNFSRNTMETIERLGELGVVIVLDDFGTGYSSFNTLHKLPVKVLKTDKTFITGMESDNYLQNLFSVMITLAHGSDMKLVAEGVENDLQVRLLLMQGTDFFQGYFFSPPLTAKQLEENLDYFHHSVEQLTAIRHTWNSPGLGRGRNGHFEYNANSELHKLLLRCEKEIFNNPDSVSAIEAVLEHIGMDMKVNRTVVVLKEADDNYSVIYEWNSQDTPTLKSLMQHFPYEQNFPRWANIMERDGFIAIPNIKTLRKDVYLVLNRAGVKAFLHFPIRIRGELCGYMEIQHCQNTHRWTKDEVQTLHNLTDIVAMTLEKIGQIE